MTRSYQNRKWRLYRLIGYIEAEKQMTKMIKKLSSKFPVFNTDGEKTTIIMGDYSQGKHMRGKLPIRGKKVLTKLAECYDILLIDEFRTSCLYHVTGTRVKNLRLYFAKDRSKKKGVCTAS